MSKTLVSSLLLFLFVVSIPKLASSTTNFEDAKEQFFTTGKETCLRNMTTYPHTERLVFCDCTDKLHRESVTDKQLKELFSRKINLDQLLAPARKKYDLCDRQTRENST